MTYEVKIIADSLAPSGKRLTTLTATYPRFIHAEVMTHRAFERNAASSRAIPWAKMRQNIIDNPVVPLVFGSEQKGMQTGGEVEDRNEAEACWLAARNDAIRYADELHQTGVHKSLVNRIVEPWMWITTIVTATEWNNFFRQRCHPDAEIHFQKIAGMIREAMKESEPVKLKAYEWHLPFIDSYDREYRDTEGRPYDLRQVSTARVARVSYLTHDNIRSIPKDLELFDRLVNGSGFGHWSPHGHVAEAMPHQCESEFGWIDGKDFRSGPFLGWKQYRKEFANENAAG